MRLWLRSVSDNFNVAELLSPRPGARSPATAKKKRLVRLSLYEYYVATLAEGHRGFREHFN